MVMGAVNAVDISDDIPLWALMLTSWPAVYALMLLPLAGMAANFAFGRCGVAEALETRQGMDLKGARGRTRGRVSLVVVFVCFLWQLHALYVVSTKPGAAPLPVWATFGPSTAFFLFFTRSVTARPHAVPGKVAAAGGSLCSKCGVRVPGMDHHCFWIHNCVGAHNRLSFVATTVSGMLSACLCLGLGAEHVVAAIDGAGETWRTVLDGDGDAAELEATVLGAAWSVEIILGWAVSLAAALGCGWLSGHQLWLLARGETTLGRLKAETRKSKRVAR